MNLDPDRTLALSYVPTRRRAAVEALWRLDLAMGQALAGGREPLISRIKLAWWREALEKLDHSPAPSEPVLQAVGAHVLPAGVSGAELAAMEEGWAVLLSPERLAPTDLEAYAAARGGLLFRHSATLLGGAPDLVRGAGETWALVDLARHSADAEDVGAAVTAARAHAHASRWPARLRPLGMLAALARRDAEEGRPRWEDQGAPGRMVRMLRLRLAGF